MQSLSVVTMVTIAFALSGGECQTAYKCDTEFQNKIKDTIWKEFGQPNNILKTSSQAGKEFVVWTTKNYYPEGVHCVYTEFGRDGKTVKLITDSGSVTSAPEETPLEEHDGTVEEKVTHIKRVHIYSKDDIVVWYKCKNNGLAGPLEVAMKVKHGSYDENKVNDVKQLIHVKLDIEFEKSYQHDCDQQTKDAGEISNGKGR